MINKLLLKSARLPFKIPCCALAALLFAGLAYGEDNTDLGHVEDQTCVRDRLKILLTNDDGYDQPGIRALHNAFKQAGHRIILVAPSKNVSGSSASITFGPVEITQFETDVYAITGSPATAVLLGTDAFFADDPPDLVISGINKGANLGPATPFSGTVGATVAAALLLQPAVPAIAISTDPLNISPGDDDENTNADRLHLTNITEFIVALVNNLQLQHCDGSALLVPGVALNINYPPLLRENVKGIQLHHQGKEPLFKITYTPSGENSTSYTPRLQLLPPVAASAYGDSGAYHKGYITIVPIAADYSAGGAVYEQIAPALERLLP